MERKLDIGNFRITVIDGGERGSVPIIGGQGAD